MDNNQLFTMLQQYSQQGKDIDTLLSDYTALASAGKTPLGLNQWVHSDKPRMEDFNEDNRIIDGALLSLEANKASITDTYTKTQIDEQMANKAKKETPARNILTGGDFGVGGFYWKTDDNMVVLIVAAGKEVGTPVAPSTLGVLPEVFRPESTQSYSFNVQLRSSTAGIAVGSCTLIPNTGVITLSTLSPAMTTSGVLNSAYGSYVFFTNL